MKRYATLIVSLVLLGVLTMPAFAHHTFTESFTTTTYEDTVHTTADWDTTVGDIKPLPFVPTFAGLANLAGPALGVAMSGNLAFVADGNSGLQIVDISDPANPTLAGAYGLPGSAWNVAVSGNFAFVADYNSGLRIIDISNPATPTLAGSYFTPGYVLDVAVAGDLAFVAADSLDIIDISDPTNPTRVGAYGEENSISGVAVSGNLVFTVDQDSLEIIDISDPANPMLAGAYPSPTGNARGVAVSGNLALVADGPSGLEVIDISDPTNPTLVGAYDTPGAAIGVAVSGNLAFVADDGDLLGIDISDPTNPVLAETYNFTTSNHGVAVAGDLAFVAVNSPYGSLDIIRISNPTPPALVGTYDTSDAVGVAVDGDLVFVGDYASGLKVIDISDPTNPTLVGAYSDPTGPEYDVAVSGNLAFVADGPNGLLVVDISDPTNPTLTGAFDTGYSANGVAVAGDLAFVADYDSLEVIDISDPTNPTLTGAFNTGHTAHRLAVDGNLAFVADVQGGLEVIDITNPASPTLAGTYATSDYAYDVVVDGDLAFVADENGGLQIIDISDPSNPTLAGTFDTASSAVTVAVAGNRAFVGEANNGLQVVDISDPTNPTLAGTYNAPSADVSVAGDFAFVAGGLSGLQVVQVFQHEVSPYLNYATSLPVDGASDLIVRARLSSTQIPDVSWELSADGGATFDSVTAGGDWAAFTTPGSDLVWRSTLTWAAPGGPSVSDVTIDWLNEFGLIASVTDIPNDQGKQVRLQWTRSGHDFVGDAQQIVEYAVYRKIDPNLTRADARATAPSFDNLSAAAREKTLMMQAAGWDFVTTVPVRVEDSYAVVVPTLADSTIANGGYMTTFMVSALTATPGVFFDSPPDSGYSIDNLAPSVPANFAVAYNTGSGNTLSWDPSPDADFQYFRVYRSIDPNFTPGPGDLLQSTTSTGWVDPAYDGGAVYYKVTATDFAGNESGPASASSVTSLPGTPVPTSFALHQNIPNPFNPMTTIRYDVARGGGNVTLAIYDVGGRLVKTLVEGHESAGQKRIEWDGRNDAGQPVASGAYFYRLTAPGFTQTRKMVLLK